MAEETVNALVKAAVSLEDEVSSSLDVTFDYYPTALPEVSVMDWNPLAPAPHEDVQPPPQCMLRIKSRNTQSNGHPPTATGPAQPSSDRLQWAGVHLIISILTEYKRPVQAGLGQAGRSGRRA
ncbi:hypothetical protein J6590_089943 [Homalodisca vitripennis]|nr:hypothetical protein J6590_089943 [Homalodisca vitripennis]